MHAVIFEVEMNDGRDSHYFDLAAGLRGELEKIDGFISVERFESLTTKGKYVSLSFWHNEAAITRWREHEGHRTAQREGLSGIFKYFRIRVAQVERDYDLNDRARTIA